MFEATVDGFDELHTFMANCRKDPLCTVRNRGAYIHFVSGKDPLVHVYEKQGESEVDLTMGIIRHGRIETGGMITEWLADYPSYSILSGDKQTFSTKSTAARIEYNDTSDIGVEICLDHRLKRLRRTVDMKSSTGAADRTTVDNLPLVKQFIPSGGMQILDYSVAAGPSSIIFNADGCDMIYIEYNDTDSYILKKKGSEESGEGESGEWWGIANRVYCAAVQSKWVRRSRKYEKYCYSHSQFASTTSDSHLTGYDNSKGDDNTIAKTYTGEMDRPSNRMTDAMRIKILPQLVASNIFAANHSELHHYSPNNSASQIWKISHL